MRSVAVVDLSSGDWSGGGAYTAVVARSLARAAGGVEVRYVSARPAPPGTVGVPLGAVAPLPLEGPVRTLLRRPARSGPLRGEKVLRDALPVLPDATDPQWVALHSGADVVFPVMRPPRRRPAGVGLVGWLPDFQHVTHPQFFSERERAMRDRSFAAVAERCDVVVLSSEAVRADFEAALPAHRHKVRVLPFPSRYAFTAPGGTAAEARAHYHLPERYLLCANQFWAHKNHLLLIEALRVLRERGTVVPLVLTGLLADYRDAGNALVSDLMQRTAAYGLHEQVHVLGLVPAAHLDGLLRGAAAVVQPSASEGWNTTVEDAKALGRPLLCSDIAVHHEQAPAAALFAFEPASVADAIAALWSGDGPDPVPESLALEQERAFAATHGEGLLEACRTAAAAR